MTRVLFLAPQPFYRLRGMCIAQKSCLEVLSRLDARVDLLTFPFGEDVVIPGVRILRLPALPGMRDVPIGPSWQKAALAPVMLLSAIALIIWNRYDVVHACEESAFFMAPLSRLLGFRLVYDMDDVLSARVERSGFVRSRALLRLLKAWERRTIGRADLVLTNSRETTAYARRFARPERVHFYDHIPPLPEAAPWTRGQRQEFREANGLEGRRVILYAGNLESYQGVSLLLESLAPVFRRFPDAACLIIGGESAQVEDLRDAVRRMGLAGKIELLGKRPLAETFLFMRAADVLVSPMTQEKAVPMKLYAYLASGTPIVATDLPNHTQLLGPGKAVLARPNPAALAEAILQALRPGSSPLPGPGFGALGRAWSESEELALRGAYKLLQSAPARVPL